MIVKAWINFGNHDGYCFVGILKDRINIVLSTKNGWSEHSNISCLPKKLDNGSTVFCTVVGDKVSCSFTGENTIMGTWEENGVVQHFDIDMSPEYSDKPETGGH